MAIHLNAMNWISCKDRLPENGEVLAVNNRNDYLYGTLYEAVYNGKEMVICECSDLILKNITHWMIPTPPETVTEKI